MNEVTECRGTFNSDFLKKKSASTNSTVHSPFLLINTDKIQDLSGFHSRK